MKVLTVALASLLCWTAAPRASAQDAPSADDGAPTATSSDSVAEARAAFIRGTELTHEGQWTEALTAFQESESLHPHVVTTYNIGFVERALGHYTRARAALRASLKTTDAEEALPDDLAEDARRYLDEVSQALGRVRLEVSPPDAAIAVDGRPLVVDDEDATTMVAGIAPPGDERSLPDGAVDLLIDPGAHVAILSREGSPDRVFRLSIARGARGPAWQLSLPPKTKPAAEPAPSKAVRPPPERDAPAVPPRADRTLAFVALGAGAAGLAVGTVFGIVALNEDSDLSDACPGKVCPPSRSDDRDALELHANLATVGFIVAGVGGALGLTFLMSDGGSPESAQVRGFVGPGRAGVDGRF